MESTLRLDDERGYAMAALLVGLGVMAVMLSVALPSWRTLAQREREAELVFRGQQYARAIALYQRRYANAFPPTIDLLVEQRFLRRKYLDPVTGGEFQLLLVGQPAPGQGPEVGPGGGGVLGQQGRGGTAPPAGLSAQPLGGRGGIMGVTSSSPAASLREYNGRSRYNEWAFVATETSTQAGTQTGSQNPGGGLVPGARGGGNGQGPGRGDGGRGRGGLPQGQRGSGLQPFEPPGGRLGQP